MSLAERVERRLLRSPAGREIAGKVFPAQWSFLLGEIALYAFVVLLVTGIYLAFFFDARSGQVVYQGVYEPLRGVVVSRPYASVLEISFVTRAGLLVRQAHHWAALVFIAAIALHAARVFFTGAFRRPRRLTWVVGVALLALAMASGFTGYSLPDDLLGGTGLRIAYTFVLSVPVIGPRLAFLLFGGEFPAEGMIVRLFYVHVFVLPAVIVALIGMHLFLVWRRGHTQFPGEGRSEHNVVGERVWPGAGARSAALFCFVVAGLGLLAGLVQVNPVWLYGPFEPAGATVPAQPVWFLGWVEGALRLLPPVRIVAFDREIPHPFFAGVLLPSVVFTALFAWPFVESRITGDRSVHHLADPPSARPGRTAVGAGVLAFLVALLAAASNDLQAQAFNVSVTTVTWVYRFLVLVAPAAVALVTWKVACDRSRGGVAEGPAEGARASPRRG